MSDLVKPEVKGLWATWTDSGHAVEDVAGWKPLDDSNFGARLQVFIGEVGSELTDSFDIWVCSPRWLAANWDHAGVQQGAIGHGVLSGRHLLLMERWDAAELRAALDEFLGGIEASAWMEVGNRIGRVLPWEFDYRYDQAQDRTN